MLKKRSVTISGHATSVSLETEFWEVLEKLAKQKKISVASLIAEIDENRTDQNLSSAIRVYVLKQLQL